MNMEHVDDRGPLGRACIVEDRPNGRKWVAMQRGGLPGDGEGMLKLSLALSALRDAMHAFGLAGEHGPAPVVVEMSEECFLRLRECLLRDAASSWSVLFKNNPRNKRIDPDKRSFMLGGVVVRAGDLDGVSFRCPAKAGGRTP